jgi:hypothetical protein
MNQVKTRIVLTRAADDPKVNKRGFQEELGIFSAALRSAGVEFTVRGMAFDSAGAVGYQLPEFMVVLGPAVVAAVAAICGAWVQARYGRGLRVKSGHVEAEGRNVEEIERLLRLAADFQRTKSKDGDTS